MKKLIGLFAIVFLGTATMAPARRAPDTTVRVSVTFNQNNIPTPCANAQVRLWVGYYALGGGGVPTIYTAQTDSSGVATFGLYTPSVISPQNPTPPTAIGPMANASCISPSGNLLQGSNHPGSSQLPVPLISLPISVY